MISAPELRATAALSDSRHAADLWQISLMASALAHVRGERAVAGVRAEPRVQRLRVCGGGADVGHAHTSLQQTETYAACNPLRAWARSGQAAEVRFGRCQLGALRAPP